MPGAYIFAGDNKVEIPTAETEISVRAAVSGGKITAGAYIDAAQCDNKAALKNISIKAFN
jgi:hypothetical protein